ncbi:unnamed protein product [Meganyctiphanes norvegica]|uniref:BHLH domain-containing protein n=1 Tax=Meganyctiphanes norvegica TaxID=48144 RepID=A0AAV2RW90_MEGNR
MRSSIAVIRRRNIQAAAPVVRKYHRLRRRRCLRMEYKKLRSLLPGSQQTTPQLNKKVGVVDAAYEYICELQAALLAKFSAKGVPAELMGVLGGDSVTSPSDIQALAVHLIQTGQVPHKPSHQQQQSSRPTSTSTTVTKGRDPIAQSQIPPNDS